MPWFAWVLIGILLLINITLGIALTRKKPDAKPQNSEERIFLLYQQIEEMLDSFEDFVSEMHASLDEKRSELLELNRQAQVMYRQTLEMSRPTPAPPPSVAPMPEPSDLMQASDLPKPKAAARREKPDAKPSRLTDKDKEALGRLATKPQKVRYLMSRGMSLEEVAKELDIGKGEVILIAELDKS